MQLDPNDPLLKLASVIPWQEFEESFSVYYTAATGAPSKPIRLMVGLLILKQLENLSDESDLRPDPTWWWDCRTYNTLLRRQTKQVVWGWGNSK